MFKKLLIVIMFITLSLSGCKAADILTTGDIPNREWEVIESSVKGTTLNIYLTTDDDKMRKWFSGNFSEIMSELYEVTVVVKTLTFNDVMNTLDAEKIDENENGSLDLLILKDDEFTKLKNAHYLYEKVTEKLPNYDGKINVFNVDVIAEHGTALDGYGVPIGRSQMIMLFDEDALETYPHDPEALLNFLKDNGPLFTYANPVKDESGAKFVRSIVYSFLTDEEKLMIQDPNITYEALETMLMPGMSYLKDLDTYLLKNKGEYYSRQAEIDDLFLEGELYYTVASDFNNVEDRISDETYPQGAKSFVFETGTITDTLYAVIPYNAANKSGALIAINNLIGLETQIDKYAPSNWGNLPILDLKLLSDDALMDISKVSVKRSSLRVEDLQPYGIPDFPLQTRMWINDIWENTLSK